MAKRGPKPKPSDMKAISGSDQPCRTIDPAFAEPRGGASLQAHFQTLREYRPTLAAVLLAIWNDQIGKLRRRGQQTAEIDRALYQLCLLEAPIHERVRLGIDIPAANNSLLQKLISNIEEVRARGGEMHVWRNRPPSGRLNLM